jgi:hypothetical protein
VAPPLGWQPPQSFANVIAHQNLTLTFKPSARAISVGLRPRPCHLPAHATRAKSPPTNGAAPLIDPPAPRVLSSLCKYYIYATPPRREAKIRAGDPPGIMQPADVMLAAATLHSLSALCITECTGCHKVRPPEAEQEKPDDD